MADPLKVENSSSEVDSSHDSMAAAKSNSNESVPRTLREIEDRNRNLGENQFSLGRLLFVCNFLGLLMACLALSVEATISTAIVLVFLLPLLTMVYLYADVFCVRFLGTQLYPFPRRAKKSRKTTWDE